MSSAASTADGVNRTREGVPGWDGDASSFREYVEAAELYEQSVVYHKRGQVAPRLIAELRTTAGWRGGSVTFQNLQITCSSLSKIVAAGRAKPSTAMWGGRQKDVFEQSRL